MGQLKAMGWKGFSGDMWANARRNCIPISGTFELTPLCNFRCRMCYVRLDASEVARHGRLLNTEEWLDIATQAMELGTYHLTLTGGEVLTRQDFPELYRKLIEKGLLTSVLSNGSLVDDAMVELFRTYAPTHLRFTLYGSSNETYERLCGISDGFDRVMASLKALKRAKVAFSLAFTVTTENVNDTEAVLDIAESLGVNIGVTANLLPAVRHAKSDAETLRLSRSEEPRITRPIDNYRPNPLGTHRHELADDLFRCCKSYRTSFFVDWNGRMESCAFMSGHGANLLNEPFELAWKHLNDRLSSLIVPETCRACPAWERCPICPGMRQAETGSANGIPSSRCEEIRAQLRNSECTCDPKEVNCNEEDVRDTGAGAVLG